MTRFGFGSGQRRSPYYDGRLNLDETNRVRSHQQFLLTRLPRVEGSGAVDVADKVVLTHLRTDLIAEQEDLSLAPGDVDPLVAIGGGAGKQHEDPIETLSALLAALNERFGMDMTDADRIYWVQQEAHLVEDETVQAAAKHNDIDQYRVFVEPVIEDKIIDRHDANDALFQAFFDKPDFRTAIVKWLVESSYERIRAEQGEAS